MAALTMVRSSKPDEVDRVARDLAKLNEQGSKLVQEIERLAAAEDQAETPPAVMSAMAQTRAARNRLKRIEAEIVATRERLAAAKATARGVQRGELLARFAPAARDFLAKAAAAREAFNAVIGAREALLASGFRQEHDSLPIPPGIAGNALLAPDLLSMFERAVSPPPRLSAVAAPPARPPARPSTFTSRVVVSPFGSGAPRKQGPVRETAGEGEQLVVIVRPGVERGGRRLAVGDKIALPLAEVEGLLRSGAADLVLMPATSPEGVAG